MNIFERIAQCIGYTFNAHIARSQTLKYIPDSYIIIGLLLVATIIIGITFLIQKRKKK